MMFDKHITEKNNNNVVKKLIKKTLKSEVDTDRLILKVVDTIYNSYMSSYMSYITHTHISHDLYA